MKKPMVPISSCLVLFVGLVLMMLMQGGEGEEYECPRSHAGGAQCERLLSLATLISRDAFEEMLKHSDTASCEAPGFYTYDAFIQAAQLFPDFGNLGDNSTRLREIAAFFAQTSFTTDGGSGSPDRYAWGYCIFASPSPANYCLPSNRWPCVDGKDYYPRGPFPISYNINYGPIGEAIGVDLLSNPDLVDTDPVISFQTAISIWMTKQDPKPSSHAVMVGEWIPSQCDKDSGRLPGFGVTTNILNEDHAECGNGEDYRGEIRIGYYKRYCDILNVDYGENIDCYNQEAFGNCNSSLASI